MTATKPAATVLTGAALAQAILDQITETPEQFDMRDWAVRHYCGTTYCVAGWAVALNGGSPRFYSEGRGNTTDQADMPDGSVVDIAREACLLLDLPLSRYNDHPLFYLDEEEAVGWLRQYAETGVAPEVAE